MTFEEAALDRQTMLGSTVPATKTIHEELFTLQSVFPDAADLLPALFQEAVLESSLKLLGRENAGKLIQKLEGTDLGNQHDVFAAIDKFCPQGGSLVKSAIAAQFHADVKRVFVGAIGAMIDSEDAMEMKLAPSAPSNA